MATTIELHLVGLSLMVERSGQPMHVLLPSTRGHGPHEHQVWIAYRADQATRPWPDGEWPEGRDLRARRISTRAAIDFTDFVVQGAPELPAGLVSLPSLTGESASPALLGPKTVKDHSVQARVTLPAGRGQVDPKGGNWRVNGVGNPIKLHVGVDWSMELMAGHNDLTLPIRDLDTYNVLTTLPTLTPTGGKIELWVFHAPADEVAGKKEEPCHDDESKHFPMFYHMPDLGAGDTPVLKYHNEARRRPPCPQKSLTDTNESVLGINPFTCMVGGDP
jgi:hypothetical protein